MNNQRVAIFLDGSNLTQSKRFDIKIKIGDVIKRVETKRKVTDIFYYTALLDKSINEEKYKEHKRFLDKIKKIQNFHVVLCNLRKVVLPDGSVDFAIKGDDVYLATDLIKGSYENLYDVAIIVSGDADFIPAINLVRKNGKKRLMLSFRKVLHINSEIVVMAQLI
jgi:uncharacterized LabA/DUF88 family protein